MPPGRCDFEATSSCRRHAAIGGQTLRSRAQVRLVGASAAAGASDAQAPYVRAAWTGCREVRRPTHAAAARPTHAHTRAAQQCLQERTHAHARMSTCEHTATQRGATQGTSRRRTAPHMVRAWLGVGTSRACVRRVRPSGTTARGGVTRCRSRDARASMRCTRSVRFALPAASGGLHPRPRAADLLPIVAPPPPCVQTHGAQCRSLAWPKQSATVRRARAVCECV